MEPRISIVTVVVDDLDRMAAFYEAMGFVRHQGITEGVAFFQAGGSIFALYPRTEAERDAGLAFGRGTPSVYLAYNTRSEEEVDAVLQKVISNGGKVIREAGRAFWGGWFGYFADPEGNLWEVAENPDFPIGADGNIRLPG